MMKIVIVGAGFTGVQLAKLLINEKNQVSIVDNNPETIKHATNLLDCTVLCADGNSLETLEEVGIAKADALVCVTESDEINMITCSLVDAVYPNVLKIARVRNYAYYVNTEKAQKKHANDFGEKHRPLYGIDYMIHPDVEAADAIVKAVENGAVGNVISFDNTDLELARILVAAGSDLERISLKEIRTKTDFPFLVAYVEKNGEASLPTGDTVIEAETVLGVIVSKKNLQTLNALCGSKHKEFRKIALIGAGKIGTIIAERLIKTSKKEGLAKFFTKRNQELVIIDSNHDLTEKASELFSNDARVLCIDATDEASLREEGITSFDLTICATHNHELNMVMAAYHESLGVKRSIALVANAEFGVIATKLGVDVSIPLRDTVVDSIMSHLRGKAVKEVHTIATGNLEIGVCEVSPTSKFAGRLLKDIQNPGTFLVLLDKHAAHNEYTIASGNTQIFPGDHIVVIANTEDSKKVQTLFAGKE